MVIRRIREHVSTHDWFAVFVDVLIVIVGVFIGTQVSNWNAERLDQARAGEYRLRLIEELDFNVRQYALQAAYYRHAKNYGLQALADLEGSRPLPDLDFIVAAYQATQTDTTKPKTGVFSEMAAGGLTDRLGDAETQALASDFYLSAEVTQRVIETIFPYRTLLREVMPYSVQIRVREACGDRNVYYNERLVGIRLVVPCQVEIDPALTSDAARRVRSTPNLQRELTRYVAAIDEKLDNLILVHGQAEQFGKRLAEGAGKSAT